MTKVVNKYVITIFSILSLLVGGILTSCHQSHYQNYSTFKTVIVAQHGYDGYLVRVQGRGSSKKQAIENARRQAVHDVIFQNLHKSYGDHAMVFAIVNDPGMEQRYADFFSEFFDGPYKDYLDDTDEKMDHSGNDTTETVVINVPVKRGALEKYIRTQLANQ